MKKFALVLALVLAACGVAFAADVKQPDYPALAAANKARGANLGEAAPAWKNAFSSFGGEVLKDGALPLKTKELIALALGLQAHCEGCITSHVQNAIKAGVTRDELVDMLGVCVLMGGGPSSSYAGIVLEAYDQFKAIGAAK